MPIYYDPKEPTRAIISEDPDLTKTRKSSQSFNKWILRIMFLSIALMVCALMIPNLLVTTVRELDRGYRSLVDEKPQLLRYTQSIDGAEILNIEINDETLVKESLASIIEIKVSKMGEYIDMYRPDYRDFVFVFGSGELSFCFVGDSYFSYDGCYYEIKESKLAELISDIYTYGNYVPDDNRLRIKHIDNGDEARSLLEISLLVGDEYLTSYIEGGYEVLDIKTDDDGYLLWYSYGDYYNHSTVRCSRICTMDGEIMIMDVE